MIKYQVTLMSHCYYDVEVLAETSDHAEDIALNDIKENPYAFEPVFEQDYKVIETKETE